LGKIKNLITMKKEVTPTPETLEEAAVELNCDANKAAYDIAKEYNNEGYDISHEYGSYVQFGEDCFIAGANYTTPKATTAERNRIVELVKSKIANLQFSSFMDDIKISKTLADLLTQIEAIK